MCQEYLGCCLSLRSKFSCSFLNAFSNDLSVSELLKAVLVFSGVAARLRSVCRAFEECGSEHGSTPDPEGRAATARG